MAKRRRKNGRDDDRVPAAFAGFKPPSDEKFFPAIRQHIIDYHNTKLELSLGLREPRIAWERQVPVLACATAARMTRQAYEKTMTIARLAAQGREPTPEIYLHMMKERGGESISDVMIAHDQVATPGRCATSPAGNIASMTEMVALDRAYAGWCHSHGRNGVFHSAIDDRNLETLMDFSAIRHTIRINDVTREVTIIPSIVVNIRGEGPYCSIGIRYHPFGDDETIFVQKRGMEVVFEEGQALEYSSQELLGQIEDRVRFSGCKKTISGTGEVGWIDPLRDIDPLEQIRRIEEDIRNRKDIAYLVQPKNDGKRKSA